MKNADQTIQYVRNAFYNSLTGYENLKSSLRVHVL